MKFLAAKLLALILCSSAFAIDYTVTAANVLASANAQKLTGTAGASITAGQSVYEDPTTSTWKLADCNGASPLYKVAGIALHAALTGQPITVCTSDPAFTPGFTVAAGDVVILSSTAGGLAPVADAASGHFVSLVGIGIGTNQIKLSIVRSDVAK